jgi:hypothetical protein
MTSKDYESKYTVTELQDGFVVSGKERKATTVKLDGATFIIKSGGLVRARVGLFDYYTLSRYVAAHLMEDWKAPEDKQKTHTFDDGREEKYTQSWVFPWVVTQCAKAIGKRVHEQWKRLLNKLDPQVIGVQKAIYAATFGDIYHDPSKFDEAIYTDPWLVNDIIKYRAAAIAAANINNLKVTWAVKRILSNPTFKSIEADLKMVEEEGKALGVELTYSFKPTKQAEQVNTLEALANWRGLFSYNGEPYPSLNKTLMNLPGGIPSSLFCTLPGWQLEKPYTERLPLLALLLYGNRVGGNTPEQNHGRIFEFATTNEIKRAMGRVGDHLHTDLSHRRARDVRTMVKFVSDYPEPHNGRLGGLVTKSIHWHRHRMEEEAKKQAERLGADTQAAKPAILPDIPGITFLDTVGAICEEGAQMNHCVSSYAENAVRGRYYLFHVQNNGDYATVQMSPDGKVIQAHGPQNRRNGAVTWGSRVLNRWASENELGQPVILGTLPEQNYNDDIPF